MNVTIAEMWADILGGRTKDVDGNGAYVVRLGWWRENECKMEREFVDVHDCFIAAIQVHHEERPLDELSVGKVIDFSAESYAERSKPKVR